jgi:hypothetical protein
LLVESGTAYQVDIEGSTVKRVGEGEADVFSALYLRGDTIALGRTSAFETLLLGAGGATKRLPGVLVAASPDGGCLLMAHDRERFDTGFRRRDRVSKMALELRATGSDVALSRFELSGSLEPHHDAPHRVLLQAVFSKDGTRLATVEGTGPITIRDVASAGVLQVLRVYQDMPYPMGVAFHPSGDMLLTGGTRIPNAEHGTLLWRRADRGG